ncbi:PREDICTED: leucine-rich repeat extensin-like protein 1 [Tarenaya hassleriana]|uniref:leucine-rich repeat extensin-like protein 1 n=1 Tax=Tarenaya hassleriana TaxID=28532 RepID=UPI00053C3B80|nr:PREDICTED: leucine-rich repeat extensin-like protein 1 [Tarenaya hassleriana]
MTSSEPFDLVITVVSAKHLKNVNWREGDLKPFVVLYLDPDHRLSTRSDDSGSTKPVWNERITLPLTRPVHESVVTVEIFHSKSSDLAKTLVGSVRFPLAHLVDSDPAILPDSVQALELVRPSGRPQGKIRLKLAIKERQPSPLPPPPQPQPPPPPRRPLSQPQDYYSAPQGSYYYSSAPQIAVPPPPPPRDYREFSPSPSPYPYSDHYYTGFYYPHPPPPSRPMYDRSSNYSLPSGPSAPVDSITFSSNDHKPLPPPPVAPRLSNYVPPPSGPSAPVGSLPVNDYMPQPPPVGSRLSNNYGVPSGPSAPVDYSPYDQRQLQKTMGGLNLDEERGPADRSESEFGTRGSYSYGGDYRRDC